MSLQDPGETPPKYDADSATLRRGRSRGKRVVSEWKLEMVSLTISILALVTIWVVLWKKDGDLVVDRKSAINLNAVMSILTTILKLAMLAVVGEVVGQSMWYWLNQPRPLSHLKDFYGLGHGSWYSLKVFFQSRIPLLATLGCIVTITAVTIDPFVQQSVKNVPCNQPAPEAEAWISAATVLPEDYVSIVTNGSFDSYAMSTALLGGFLYPERVTSSIPFSCSTGNCTFHSHNGVTHTSLGICSTCLNTTELVRETEIPPDRLDGEMEGMKRMGYNYSLPNGLFLSRFNYTAINGSKEIYDGQASFGTGLGNYYHVKTGLLDWADAVLTEQVRGYLDVSLLNISMIGYSDCELSTGPDGEFICQREQGLHVEHPPPDSDIMAVSCVMYGCLRSSWAKVNLGSITETVVSTAAMTPVGKGIELPSVPDLSGLKTRTMTGPTIAPLPTARPPAKRSESEMWNDKEWASLNTPCIVDGLPYDLGNMSAIPPARNRTFMPVILEGDTTVDVPQQCLYRFSTALLLHVESFLYEMMNGYCGPPEGCGSDWWLRLFADDTFTFRAVNHAMDGLSLSATNYVRAVGRDGGGFEPGIVNGTAYQTLVCTRFNYPWLIFPSLLVMAAAAMLLAILVKRAMNMSDVPAWKSSILPLLFHSPLLGRNRGLDGPRSVDGMEVEADNILVRLREDGTIDARRRAEADTATTADNSEPPPILSLTRGSLDSRRTI